MAMKSCAANALRIAGELNFVEVGTDPCSVMFQRIVSASETMAKIEMLPGFHWNDGTTNDWESVCAAIAMKIEGGGSADKRFILAQIGILNQ